MSALFLTDRPARQGPRLPGSHPPWPHDLDVRRLGGRMCNRQHRCPLVRPDRAEFRRAMGLPSAHHRRRTRPVPAYPWLNENAGHHQTRLASFRPYPTRDAGRYGSHRDTPSAHNLLLSICPGRTTYSSTINIGKWPLNIMRRTSGKWVWRVCLVAGIGFLKGRDDTIKNVKMES